MRRGGTGGSNIYAYIWDVQVKQTTVVVVLLLLASCSHPYRPRCDAMQLFVWPWSTGWTVPEISRIRDKNELNAHVPGS